MVIRLTVVTRLRFQENWVPDSQATMTFKPRRVRPRTVGPRRFGPQTVKPCDPTINFFGMDSWAQFALKHDDG